MIPTIYKLKLRKIVNFFEDCERHYSKYFLVFYHQKKEGESRVVVIVPKKNIKLRVMRSKIKRQVYSLCLPLVREFKGLDLAMVVNKKIITAKKQDIFNDLKEIFSRLSQK
jgi:ribonuclease P protein component